jgi:hypothetical protein
MARTGVLVAAAVVVGLNLATLVAVSMNRSGEPEAVLDLTERELSLPPREAENTALTLRLEWVDPEVLRPGPGWFDRRKLEEIGFDCRPPVTPENREHFQGQIPRAVFAVLEYEGEAWRRYMDEPTSSPAPNERFGDARRAQRDPARRLRGSHLVLVDVGLDPAALRARYPDRRRHVVVAATSSLVFVQDIGQPPRVEGRVAMILPQQLNVPRDQRRLLETLQTERRAQGPAASDQGTGEPRYRATVKWGRRFEPWLVEVQPSGK